VIPRNLSFLIEWISGLQHLKWNLSYVKLRSLTRASEVTNISVCGKCVCQIFLKCVAVAHGTLTSESRHTHQRVMLHISAEVCGYITLTNESCDIFQLKSVILYIYTYIHAYIYIIPIYIYIYMYITYFSSSLWLHRMVSL